MSFHQQYISNEYYSNISPFYLYFSDTPLLFTLFQLISLQYQEMMLQLLHAVMFITFL